MFAAISLAVAMLSPCQPAIERLRAEHVSGADLLSRSLVCADVAITALAHGVDPDLAVTVAFHESRMDWSARSGAGAVGPMQVVPRYWCPDRTEAGCDLVSAGVRALAEYTDRHGELEGLARYNGGNRPAGASYAYARTVLRGL